ncbi:MULTISPECIES: DUF3861 domain-containing protein [Sphingobacterium]|jgi:hypothetical protein|uniref:DUF3861 domain-containing protein n=1 Tax=Sphingobacterium TaxID=28453 RepID=UPI00038A239B|nr:MULTISPECIES: DUF3861 domain-containing protein [Sphingobacterium]KKX51562.1 hypothetical protein L950_0204435 [Sphingobacterium sp. IITKGP-BTPF85]MBB2950237.1 hypothetical protein [Sphingobacterium sp. JUb56]MCS3556997.1 hypothetical protein [Sphingobacterium sp. JUb21]MCW2258754.1 hypothetical protein [Sphingobacterium kitahiroshimense]NJI73132.1 DUF3861 domain-containing protein [Sphingobacterium sp. B16(2022)]
MEKRNNAYQLELKEVSLKNGDAGTKSLHLNFDNHDDLFNIFEVISSKQIFDNKETATEFALGLKLFTEVMLKNKENPLFEDLRPAILEFMKKLKSS